MMNVAHTRFFQSPSAARRRFSIANVTMYIPMMYAIAVIIAKPTMENVCWTKNVHASPTTAAPARTASQIHDGF